MSRSTNKKSLSSLLWSKHLRVSPAQKNTSTRQSQHEQALSLSFQKYLKEIVSEHTRVKKATDLKHTEHAKKLAANFSQWLAPSDFYKNGYLLPQYLIDYALHVWQAKGTPPYIKLKRKDLPLPYSIEIVSPANQADKPLLLINYRHSHVDSRRTSTLNSSKNPEKPGSIIQKGSSGKVKISQVIPLTRSSHTASWIVDRNNLSSLKAKKVNLHSFNPSDNTSDLKYEYDLSIKLGIFDSSEMFFYYSSHSVLMMPLIPGKDLIDYLIDEEDGKKDLEILTPKEKIEVMISVLNQLRYIAEQKYVHRDIKPGNIRVFRNNGHIVAKLLDPASALPEGEPTTPGGATKDYLPPELSALSDGEPTTPGGELHVRSIYNSSISQDLFAFGVTLYNCFEISPQFLNIESGKEEQEVYKSIYHLQDQLYNFKNLSFTLSKKYKNNPLPLINKISGVLKQIHSDLSKNVKAIDFSTPEPMEVEKKIPEENRNGNLPTTPHKQGNLKRKNSNNTPLQSPCKLQYAMASSHRLVSPLGSPFKSPRGGPR